MNLSRDPSADEFVIQLTMPVNIETDSDVHPQGDRLILPAGRLLIARDGDPRGNDVEADLCELGIGWVTIFGHEFRSLHALELLAMAADDLGRG